MGRGVLTDALWRTCHAAGALVAQPPGDGTHTCDVPVEVASVPVDPNHLVMLMKDVGAYAL